MTYQKVFSLELIATVEHEDMPLTSVDAESVVEAFNKMENAVRMHMSDKVTATVNFHCRVKPEPGNSISGRVTRIEEKVDELLEAKRRLITVEGAE